MGKQEIAHGLNTLCFKSSTHVCIDGGLGTFLFEAAVIEFFWEPSPCGLFVSLWLPLLFISLRQVLDL